MKKNLRGKIRDFLQSEDGKVGVKSPLALSVAVGSVLLAQAIVGTTPAMACANNAECGDNQQCENIVCHGPPDPITGQLTCVGVCLPYFFCQLRNAHWQLKTWRYLPPRPRACLQGSSIKLKRIFL